MYKCMFWVFDRCNCMESQIEIEMMMMIIESMHMERERNKKRFGLFGVR